MYNLYQSQLRKDIQSKIYQKPHFFVKIFGKEYFGLIKTKKIGPITMKWFQVLGIELPDDEALVRAEIKKIKEKYNKGGAHIFFQLGLINEIISFENVSRREESFKDDMRQMRLNVRKYLDETYSLRLTVRENMPQCNIIYDITKNDEQLMSEMKKSCRERVRKAVKNDIEFRVAHPDEYMSFYYQWKELAGHKGFNIISQDQYERLIGYMIDNKRGDIFISHQGGELVAGSICVYDEHRLIYLYGFGNSANKKFRNLGGHHFLKFKIFTYAREQGFTYVDMMGGAPTGFDDHPLAGVSKFKESLGGMKIEQYGSYDIVLNKFWYQLYKGYLKWKK